MLFIDWDVGNLYSIINFCIICNIFKENSLIAHEKEWLSRIKCYILRHLKKFLVKWENICYNLKWKKLGNRIFNSIWS